MKYLLSLATLFLFIHPHAFAQKDTLKEQVFSEYIPRFPGGDPGLMKYLREHLYIPDSIKDLPIKRINLSFVINEQGDVLMASAKLDNKKLDTTLAYDKMSYRLLLKMPKWIPARQGGRGVKYLYHLPVNLCNRQE
ncbi:hypothetical protein [uncultured Chitinophaga sp.]|uniref:hypothetical protein n=1 Tax=uncultured Chitinophaga sp. TaxID=339340 RepID=UPI0025E58FAF|nr:hypothetical protein [uncultured Chitinophaga sp.]